MRLFLSSILFFTSLITGSNWYFFPATVEERTAALSELRKSVAQSSDSSASDLLLNFEKRFAHSETASLARFRRGYDRYQSKDFSGAASLLDEKFISENSHLGDYALYYQGKSFYELRQFDRAESSLGQVAELYPSSRLARDASLLAGRSAAERSDFDAVERRLKTLLDQNDGTALTILASIQEKLGHRDDAVRTYQRIYFEAPHSLEAEAAAKKIAELGVPLNSPAMMNPRDWQTRAERFFSNKQYVGASEAYYQLRYLDPTAPSDDLSKYQYGVSLFFAKKYPSAIDYLGQVNPARKDLHSEALYYQVESQYKSGLPNFITFGERFLNLYPQSPHAGEILSQIAEYQSKRGSGEPYYTRLMREYPDLKISYSYSFDRAWKVQKSGNPTLASQLLIEHVANFPNSDYKGMSMFWAARDEETLGHPERAVALYQAILRRYRYGYYGYLSTKRIELLQSANSKLKAENPDSKTSLSRAIANIQPARPLPETARQEAELTLERASELRIIGLMDLALEELEISRQTAPTSPKINFEIAKVHRDQGDTLRAMQTLQRAHPDYLSYQGNEITREEWDIFFPMIDWEFLKREAKNNDLDPYIVAGLIRQESVFNPRAHSRANALGLMQLLPSTARLVSTRSGSGNFSAEQLYNPNLNVKLGTIYLSDMVKKFGRYEYAFAAYNAGPGRVATWLKTLPTNDIATWVEAIPFSETRLYVQGVLRNAAHYRRLYGGGER